MSSLNLCQFIGNVGKIETRYLASGDPVVNLSLAANEAWKDKAGERQEKTEWINVTIYGKLAGITSEYVEKGKQIYIAGKMTTRKWVDKDGNDRYSTEIVANDMKMLGGRSDSPSQSKQAQAQDDDSDIPF